MEHSRSFDDSLLDQFSRELEFMPESCVAQLRDQRPDPLHTGLLAFELGIKGMETATGLGAGGSRPAGGELEMKTLLKLLGAWVAVSLSMWFGMALVSCSTPSHGNAMPDPTPDG